MTNKNLLLLSSSRVGNTDYLTHALPQIKEHLAGVSNVLFIPFAGVTLTYDEYLDRVKQALTPLSVNVTSLHQFTDKHDAINQATAILVGGGNTFHLLHELYRFDLIELIKECVNNGTPYIGWSAGSNIAGLTIKTTNDMPIIEPPCFDALALINAQLNPHYTDHTPPGHNGETREQRLAEFMVINPQTPIIGIVEGTGLKVKNEEITLVGEHTGFVFKAGEKQEVAPGNHLNRYL